MTPARISFANTVSPWHTLARVTSPHVKRVERCHSFGGGVTSTVTLLSLNERKPHVCWPAGVTLLVTLCHSTPQRVTLAVSLWRPRCHSRKPVTLYSQRFLRGLRSLIRHPRSPDAGARALDTGRIEDRLSTLSESGGPVAALTGRADLNLLRPHIADHKALCWRLAVVNPVVNPEQAAKSPVLMRLSAAVTQTDQLCSHLSQPHRRGPWPALAPARRTDDGADQHAIQAPPTLVFHPGGGGGVPPKTAPGVCAHPFGPLYLLRARRFAQIPFPRAQRATHTSLSTKHHGGNS